MQAVGKKLEDLALAEGDQKLLDLYGRSAYNRYYYAAFLAVREMIRKIDGDDKRINHASVSEILEKRILKKLKLRIKSLSKKEFITQSEADRLKSSAQTATSSLSEMMKRAYDLRAIADYEPETKVEFSGSVIYLLDYKLSKAQRWFDEANAYCKKIIKLWDEVASGEF